MTESPRTARGRATRERIVAGAATLIRERGIAETSVGDVLARAGASKSQAHLRSYAVRARRRAAA